MKCVVISVGFLFLACNFAIPETVVVESPYLHSSRIVELTVLRRAQPVKGVQVTFDRYDGTKEVQFWIGLTNEHGHLLSPRLSEGKYRISAESGKRSAELYVEVKADEKLPTRFQMKLARQDGLERAEEAPTTNWVKDFKGLVFDQSGAVIPRAQVEIFRKDDLDGAPLVKMETGEKGEFAAHLENGTYVATFRSQGFKTYVLLFEVSEKGQAELHITLEVGSVA